MASSHRICFKAPIGVVARQLGCENCKDKLGNYLEHGRER